MALAEQIDRMTQSLDVTDVKQMYSPQARPLVLAAKIGFDAFQEMDHCKNEIVAQEEANCYVQLVTTQRQVVVVFTCSQPEYDSWNIVGLYYDVGLEQYSGIAINSRAGYGY